MSQTDELGSRMKTQYESRASLMLPRRTWTIVRVDGKAFHSYTRKLNHPYDDDFTVDMDSAAMALCKEAQGVAFAYGQSDEYSFLFTDFAKPGTDAWFDGKLQKIDSISSSIFTAHFLKARFARGDERPAYFDARAFTIPDPVEVENYFIWRQTDATRNSINMLASDNFSSRELHGKSTNERQEMLFTKDLNWNDIPTPNKRGRVIKQVEGYSMVTWEHKKTKELHTEEVLSKVWTPDLDIPVFTKDRKYLQDLIPKMEDDIEV